MDEPINPINAEQDTHRLLITRRAGSEILVLGNEPSWSLPRTEIPSRQRPAEQLTTAIRRRFELETYCLFVPTPPSSVRTGSNANYAVMESVKQNDPAPAGLYWMPAGVLDPCCDVEEAKAVREALGEYLAEISDEQVDQLAAATETLAQLVTLLQHQPIH